MVCRTSRRAAITILLVALPIAALAVQKPGASDGVLLDFDIRNQRPAVPGDATALAALDCLSAELGRLGEVQIDRLTGAVRRLAFPVPAPVAARQTARQGALGFLRANADLFGLASADVATLRFLREYRSRNETTTHVVFEQVVGGIRVFGASVAVHIDRGGIVWVTNSLVPVRNLRTAIRLSPGQAILAAARNIRPREAFTPVLASETGGPERASVWNRGPFRRQVLARLVYFPMDDGPRLAWRVEAEPTGVPQAYEVLVDVASGEVLYRRNLFSYADITGVAGTGTVLQADDTFARDERLPDRSPTGAAPAGSQDPPAGCPPILNYVDRSLTGPFLDASNVLAPTGRLEGNNQHVYRRAFGTEGASGVQNGAAWTFQFPFNTPSSVETALFFAVNFAHDFFYDLGFDEAAGNFQLDNFGRGGAGGDPLRVIARANGRNNANFGTPSDGLSPTMNMFLWDGTGCWAEDVDADGKQDLDGGYDLDIVLHEYHHGVTFRLNPNFSGAEAGAIGEGGGDFFAYSVNGDTNLAEYAAPPLGIRHVNDKTYGSWTCLLGLFCEPHDNGEIWANALWGVRERFRADAVDGSQETAVNTVHQLYVDALKLSPPRPTMLDMRDSMVQADRVRNGSADPGGSANFCRLWDAFAGVGMGVAARDTRDNGGNRVTEDFSTPSECPSDHLAVVTIAATQPVATEGAAPGLLTLTRTGSEDAALTVRLSLGGTASPADYVSIPGTVVMPAGTTMVDIPVVASNDGSVEGDETLVVTLRSGPGYAVGDPSGATVTIVSDDTISDLVVSSLTVPSRAGAGSMLAVGDTTANQGTGEAHPTVTGYYLSTNPFFDASDVMVGDRPVPALQPTQANAGSATLAIPAGTATGTYYIIVRADASALESEAQETNNTRFGQVMIGPDLAVSALTMPAVGGAGEIIVATDSVTNAGAGPSPSTLVRFYLSGDPTFGAGDLALTGTRVVPALAPGTSHQGSTSLLIPTGTVTGRYYVIAYVDADGALPETADSNNTRFSQIQIGPDLVVSSLTAPAAAAIGATIQVSDTAMNQGAGSAPSSMTRLYLSVNTILDASDTALPPDRSVAPLAPGGIGSGVTMITIPASTPAGAYFIVASADATAAVLETQELNNTRFAAIRIGPDLTASIITAPTATTAGAVVTITAATANQGLGIAGPSTLQLYWSTNLTFEASDTLLAELSIGPLAPGPAAQVSLTVSIPSNTPVGTYYVLAVADGRREILETQEANNVAVRAVQVR